MYENFFSIEFDKLKISSLFRETTWQDKDILYSLMCDYIPLSIKEIIPLNGYYIVRWKSKDDFLYFINDKKYQLIINFLENFSMKINWNDASAKQDR